tara:strand:+ start:3644 stop:3907 length:264 start_codon:yes stop_codon:yes gene_type:complete
MPWQLDIHADKHSYKQCPKVEMTLLFIRKEFISFVASHNPSRQMNPRALKISGGRAMETETTYQPITEKHISGDGTGVEIIIHARSI